MADEKTCPCGVTNIQGCAFCVASGVSKIPPKTKRAILREIRQKKKQAFADLVDRFETERRLRDFDGS